MMERCVFHDLIACCLSNRKISCTRHTVKVNQSRDPGFHSPQQSVEILTCTFNTFNLGILSLDVIICHLDGPKFVNLQSYNP